MENNRKRVDVPGLAFVRLAQLDKAGNLVDIVIADGPYAGLRLGKSVPLVYYMYIPKKWTVDRPALRRLIRWELKRRRGR